MAEVFNALRTGTSFNKKRFGCDIEFFQGRSRDHNGAAELDTGAGTARTAAGVEEESDKRSGGCAAAGAPAARTHDPFEEANVLRKAHRIRVLGADVPAPLKDFEGLWRRKGMPKRLRRNVAACGFLDPTPIQRQAIPLLLAGREVLAVAPTGSGKTLAFLLPLVVRAWRAARRGEPGVKALVISPTRELAAQTARALARLVDGLALRCCLLAASAAAAGTDFSRVDILLGTPLRLSRLARARRAELAGVRDVVCDEADQLLGAALLAQVDRVIAACRRPDKARALQLRTSPQN